MHTNHRRKNKNRSRSRSRSGRCRCTYCELGKMNARKRQEPIVDDVRSPLGLEVELGASGDESYWNMMEYLEWLIEYDCD